jgi:hypothetical protein
MYVGVHSNERSQTIERQVNPPFLALPIFPISPARSKAALCGIAKQ